MKRLAKLAATIAASKWFVAVSGWGIWYSSSAWYDRYAYPGLMLYFGILWGGIIASAVAMLTCTAFLIGYEFFKGEWVQSTDEILVDFSNKIEKFAGWLQKIEGYNIFLRIVLIIPRCLVQLISGIMKLSLEWISQRGILGFIALSCIADPFITISYFRNGLKDGLKAKDWGLFLLSGVVANVYWVLYNSIIVIAIELIWNFLKSLLT